MTKSARSAHELEGLHCKYCMNKYGKDWLMCAELHERDFYHGAKRMEGSLTKMYADAENIHTNRYDAAEAVIESGICEECSIHSIGMPSVYDVVEVGKALINARMLNTFLDSTEKANRKAIIQELKKYSGRVHSDEEAELLAKLVERKSRILLLKGD